MNLVCKFVFVVVSTLGILVQSAFATNSTAADDACYHNNIRNALSYGTTLNKMDTGLNNTYNFALQNRPQTPLTLMQNKASLKSSAAAYASQCVFAHSASGSADRPAGVGENLFVGTELSTITDAKWLSQRTYWVENAIANWAYEAKIVRYVNSSPKDLVKCTNGLTGENCRSEIGHYTQMVWDSTVEIGCAAHYCPNGITNFNSGKSTNIVCHYSPQGNYRENVNISVANYFAPYDGQGILTDPTNNPPSRQTCSTGASGGSSGSSGPSDFPLSAIMLLLND